MPDGDTNSAVVSGLSVVSRGRPSTSKLSVARTPVQCTGSPTRPCSSQTSVDTPRRARRSAAYRPAGPPPTTSTSQSIMNDDIIRASLRFLYLAPANFPGAPRGDPEREQDQPHVEPEAGSPDVEAIEAELAGTRDVARRVHLRQARQPGTHAVAFVVAGNLFEMDHLAVAADIHFPGPQRTRTNEAHVAAKNIHELW